MPKVCVSAASGWPVIKFLGVPVGTGAIVFEVLFILDRNRVGNLRADIITIRVNGNLRGVLKVPVDPGGAVLVPIREE